MQIKNERRWKNISLITSLDKVGLNKLNVSKQKTEMKVRAYCSL
jgi:hypothetical protein